MNDLSHYVEIGKTITENRYHPIPVDLKQFYPERTTRFIDESNNSIEFVSFHYIAAMDCFFYNTYDMDQMKALFYVMERKIPLTFVDAIRGFQIYGVINADGDTEYSLGIIMKEHSVLGADESDKFTGEYEFTRIDDHTLMLEVIIKIAPLYNHVPSRQYHLYIYLDINAANEFCHCLSSVKIRTKSSFENKTCINYVYYED